MRHSQTTHDTIFMTSIAILNAHQSRQKMRHSQTTHDTIFMTSIALTLISFAQAVELTYVINEESPARTRVGNVLDDANIRKIVSQTELSDLRFSFLSEGNPQSSFLWINSTSGELRTSSRIDREAICPMLAVCELRVKTVVQALLGAFFKIVHIKVAVKDINDNLPTFDLSTFTLKVAESETPGAYFRIPVASDMDAGDGNSALEYMVLGRGGPFTLVVDGAGLTLHSVKIRLDTTLDRETTDSYQFHVLAVDQGNPQLTGTLTVNIEVLDVNDNAPIFQQQQYNLSVSDNLTVDSSVMAVKAEDLDYGDNGLVTYILPTTQEDMQVIDMFYINRSTGEIKVKVPLDIYAGSSYRLTIQAVDGGYPYKTASTQVVISVLDTQNSQPEILLNVLGTAGVAQVSELAEMGRAVAHLVVSDPDSAHSSNGQTSCYLDNTKHFQLQPMDGQQFKVILTRRLDREQQTHHSVTVICKDTGSPPLNVSSGFIVEVGDENDNAPVFSSSSYVVEVTEGKFNNDSDKSHAILTVQAIDADSGPNARITYRLAENTDPDFGIYTDGSIVVTNPAGLDREDRIRGAVRNLVVLAVDSGRVPMTGTALMVVTIRDINDNPPRFSEPAYFFIVREDSPIGQYVGSISATDADIESSGEVSIKIHHRNINAIPFQISPDGAIKTNAGLNRENKSSYEFLIIAYDMGKPVALSSTVVMRIKISDVNDNSPKFIFPSQNNNTVYIPRTLDKHAIFATLLATDLDEGDNGELMYSLESVNGSGHFGVEPSSGQMFLLQPLTEKDIGVHVLMAVAQNPVSEVQISTSTLHVIVYEGNTTVLHKTTGLGVRNTVVVVVLLVVTVIVALTILVTILLLRFVDKDKKMRIYSAKEEEDKVESKLKDVNFHFTCTSTSASVVTTGSKDGGRRRKEVSFSLEEGGNANSGPRMTNSSLSDDVCDFSSGRVNQKIPANDVSLYYDDTGSDASVDTSTCDSGKGGSDVEPQSHLYQVKNVGDVTLQGQPMLNHPSNPSFISGGQSNTGYKYSRNIIPPPQFKNGIPVIGSCMFRSTPSAVWPRLSYSADRAQFPTQKSDININAPRCNKHLADNRFRQSINHDQCNKNHSCQEPTKSHKRTIGAISFVNRNNQFSSPSNSSNYYIDLPEATPYVPARMDSICTEETSMWDCDTTTSGSYVIDPSELNSEIDSISFGNIRDIVV